MNKLINGIMVTQDKTYTEKGATTLKSSGSDVLDFFASAAARRGQDISRYFGLAFAENEALATVAAFWLRDCRGGAGERELFRQILSWLADNKPEIFLKVFKLVPEYGRWDDLFHLVKHENVGNKVTEFILTRLTSDLDLSQPSLLVKWLPSISTSSKESVRLAAFFASELRWTHRNYRKTLSKLREKLKVVEKDMSARKWDEINFSHVPSYAGKLYRKAFLRHDGERYKQFLADVKSGKSKINASVLFPYDLVQGYLLWGSRLDETTEAQWAALPNYADTDDTALVVADLSGSMFTVASPSPAGVAVSLAVYIAERNKGVFKDYWLNFSDTPSLQKLKGSSLFEKIQNMDKNNWGGTTNFQSVFDLILNTAVNNDVPESDMPKKLFVISDMQFDTATRNNKKTNFEAIQKKYKKAGYEMPQIIFWNVAARGSQSPVTENQDGVFLVSGASPAIFKNAINAQAKTPYDLMVEVLNSDRYASVREALL